MKLCVRINAPVDVYLLLYYCSYCVMSVNIKYIYLFFYFIGTYTVARSKLVRAEETSGLETTDVDEGSRPVRRRRATALTDDADSDSDPPCEPVHCLPQPKVPLDLNWSCTVTDGKLADGLL